MREFPVFLNNLTTKKLAAIAALLFTLLPSYAISGNYKNNLLALDMQRTGGNSLNVTMFSSRKFVSPPSVSKKSIGEYLIILPETFHSITSRPNTDKTNGLIKSVAVNFLPYTTTNANNGYTKIVLKTNSENLKINIDNQIVAKNSEAELMKFIALKDQESAFSKTRKQPEPKISLSEQAQKIVIKKLEIPDNHQNSLQRIAPKHHASKKSNQKPTEQTQSKPLSFQQKALQNNKTSKANLTGISSKNDSTDYKTKLLSNKKMFYITGIACIIFPLLLLLFFLKTLSFIANRKKQQDEFQTLERLNAMKEKTTSLNEETIMNIENFETDDLNQFENSLMNEESTQEQFAEVFASSATEEGYNFNNVINSSSGTISSRLSEIKQKLDDEPISNEKPDEDRIDDLVTDFITEEEELSQDFLTDFDQENLFEEVYYEEKDDNEDENADYDFSDIAQEELIQTQGLQDEYYDQIFSKEDHSGEEEPVILGEREMAEGKTLYLVELQKEYSLVGVINEKVFVLYRFLEKPESTVINLKLNETRGQEKIYITQVGKWRSLLGLSNDMRYILTL
jgi:hypothetical protein